jgi:hypothetical protein
MGLGFLALVWTACADLDIDQIAGMIRGLAAIVGCAGAWWLSAARPARGYALNTPAAVAWLPVPLAAMAAWSMVQVHLAVPLATVDRITFLREGTPAWGFLFDDSGLPSLLHRLVNLAASTWGGVALVLCVHAALYAILTTLSLDLAVRLAGRLAGVAIVVAWVTAPPVVDVFAGLRAYPTLLLLLLLAERSMVTSHDGTPDDRGVVRPRAGDPRDPLGHLHPHGLRPRSTDPRRVALVVPRFPRCSRARLHAFGPRCTAHACRRGTRPNA